MTSRAAPRVIVGAMNRKQARLRIPAALTVVVLAAGAGAAAYGCKSQCTTESSFGGGPTNPDGGQAGGAGGTADCVTVSSDVA
jgi:hypothetical protein